ncbi:S1C family serine protease [Ornithinimicrobium sp. Y1694]|uniref:S1C family serine protease n=1 Tax=Ornithinimicrobium sp. Y1694 TaxID=3418590 RepID=UPI003CF23921
MTHPDSEPATDRTVPLPPPDRTAPIPRSGAAAAPGQGQPGRRRSGPRTVPIVLAALVAGAVGGLGGGVLAQTLTTGPGSGSGAAPETPVSPQPDEQAATPTSAPIERVEADGTIPGLSRAVLPSVALVSLGADGRDGQGSAFVIREDGYLLTNAHVVQAGGDDAEIAVTLPGGEPLTAEVVGADPAYDIAVLRVDRDDLVALPFADRASIEVGQSVVAVGAPLGLDSTVTSGIISALDRPVVAGDGPQLSYINAIQTDAAINPGNSGGPLLDLAGNVVGVNSAIAQLPTTSLSPAGSIGLGFAIPAEQAERTATQLIESGVSEHPVMGVHIDLEYTGDGARVVREPRDGVDPIIPGGPAAGAGVRPGDIIVSVDGTRITDSQHLLVVLRSKQIGQTVEMVLRDEAGEERTVEITLAGSGG